MFIISSFIVLFVFAFFAFSTESEIHNQGISKKTRVGDLRTDSKMGPKEIYLILYNLCACTGWFLVLAKALQSLSVGVPADGLQEALANVYAAEGLADLLFYSQSAALLEIAHAGLGLVRSPLIVTAMQVGSRIVALVAVTYSADAQSKPYLLVVQ